MIGRVDFNQGEGGARRIGRACQRLNQAPGENGFPRAERSGKRDDITGRKPPRERGGNLSRVVFGVRVERRQSFCAPGIAGAAVIFAVGNFRLLPVCLRRHFS